MTEPVTHTFRSPWGSIEIAAMDGSICRVILPRHQPQGEVPAIEIPAAEPPIDAEPILAEAQDQILAYLNGRLREFDLPIVTPGASVFARAVWEVCRQIPYGETRSYGWIARTIGRPKASRAVGGALGANPVPLIVPCHRVIQQSGQLGGFTAGLALKRFLLALESADRKEAARGENVADREGTVDRREAIDREEATDREEAADREKAEVSLPRNTDAPLEPAGA
jgi:methylated-DNA-[protein]-cysteine S-methyltransferase